ncbi:hypothetical protein [Luteimonas sp. e5]
MLKAVVSGKAGRLRIGSSEFSVSWRDAFRSNEDLLTGAFFGRLGYFSPQALSQLMTVLIGTDAENLGELEQIELWPSLKAPGRLRVEPDVMMRFTEGTLMVEVKPPHWGVQSLFQWGEQLRALIHDPDVSRELDFETVRFLALGGNLRAGIQADELQLPEELAELAITQREWEEVSAGLLQLRVLDLPPSDTAIIDDLLDLLELYGVAQPIAPPPPWSPLLRLSRLRALRLDCLPHLHRPRQQRTSQPSSMVEAIDWRDLLKFSKSHPLELR